MCAVCNSLSLSLSLSVARFYFFWGFFLKKKVHMDLVFFGKNPKKIEKNFSKKSFF